MIISRLAGVRMLSQECRPEPSKGLWMSLRTRLYTRYILLSRVPLPGLRTALG